MRFIFVFFFKQKTAYEMRISNWSSDVCSSDLSPEDFPGHTLGVWFFGNEYPFLSWMAKLGIPTDGSDGGVTVLKQGFNVDPLLQKQASCVRSEEHTSELQSLMRISYAVFCLKKKKKTETQQYCTRHETYTTKIT